VFEKWTLTVVYLDKMYKQVVLSFGKN